MGIIVLASCTCGFYSSELFLGVGMKSGKFYIPVACTTCLEIKSINIEVKRFSLNCSNCRTPLSFFHYLEEKLSWDKMREEDFLLCWKEKDGLMVIPNRPFICPCCGKTTLVFKNVGCWD
jgi:hypothetical protein